MNPQSKQKKEVCLYARKSTEKQSSLQVQLSALEDYCKRQNYKIVEEFKDVISGKLDKRPGFDKMISDMREGKFSAIIVYKLDRIGRSLQHLLNLFQEFEANKIDFISITQNFNTTTPEGRLMLRMMMLLAEYEREIIVVRTQDKIDYLQNQIQKKGFAITKQGKKIKSLGRPEGSKDKKIRKKGGYYMRYRK